MVTSEISTQLRDSAPAEITPEPPRRMIKFWKWFVANYLLLVAIVTGVCLWARIPALINSFQPTFTVTPQTSLDATALFATPFLLKNAGSFDAINVDVGCSPKLENVASYGQTKFENVMFSQPLIPIIHHNGPGATIQCHAIRIDQRLKLGEQLPLIISIRGRYGYKLVNFEFTHAYVYLMTGDATGHVFFQEQPD
jgi:hypothetical protein